MEDNCQEPKLIPHGDTVDIAPSTVQSQPVPIITEAAVKISTSPTEIPQAVPPPAEVETTNPTPAPDSIRVETEILSVAPSTPKATTPSSWKTYPRRDRKSLNWFDGPRK